AIEMARFRPRVGFDREPEALGDVLYNGPHCGALGTGHDDIRRATEWIKGVKVQIERGLSGRDCGMAGVILGAAQPALFRSDEEENAGALRLRFKGRPRARHLENHRTTSGVVDRAVIDAIAVHGRADAQMVPVSTEDDGFVLTRLAVDPANDIARFD